MVIEPAEVGATKDDQRDPGRTWEEVNRTLLSSARQAKLEDGAVVRPDSTVTAAPIHEPSDSSLLWDAVRVMVRLLKRAEALIGGAGLAWRDHCRAGKKRAREIQFTRGRPNRVHIYRELIAIAGATLAYLKQATERLAMANNPLIELWQAEVRHYRPLIERVVKQSERRVLAGEQVVGRREAVQPVRTSRRHHRQRQPRPRIWSQTQSGDRQERHDPRSGDRSGQSARQRSAVADAGAPDWHLGQAPRQAAADGGYASYDNLATAKAWGVRDMAFHKKAGLQVSRTWSESNWVYRKLTQLPRRHRSGNIMPQARLWPGALYLARSRPLQNLRLVFGGGLQPRPLDATQTDLTPPTFVNCLALPAGDLSARVNSPQHPFSRRPNPSPTHPSAKGYTQQIHRLQNRHKNMPFPDGN